VAGDATAGCEVTPGCTASAVRMRARALKRGL
jgi:hypothetical protein